MRQTARRLLKRGRTDFTILLGDNFYPVGVSSVEDEQFTLFDTFRESSRNFFVIPGNHDYLTQNSVESEMAYHDEKWVFPSKFHAHRIPVGESGFQICLILLDSIDFTSGQIQWLENQLSACSGKGIFRVVAGHYPVFTTGVYANDKKVSAFRDKINPILINHNVHVYLAGHEHQMQALRKDGIHYLIAGSPAEIIKQTPRKYESILKFQQTSFGFVDFLVNEDGTATYQFIESKTGEVLYSKSITFTT
jgi:tartrate-resistant acid phosphatase type 5